VDASLGTVIGDHAKVMQTFLQAPSPPSACFQLLPDIADFTGRVKETARLQALLKPAGTRKANALIISNIAGKPGVGKSALAIHVAHLLAKRFPDAQLYVNLRGQEGRPLSPADILPGFTPCRPGDRRREGAAKHRRPTGVIPLASRRQASH
jgi:hypothetical protein